MKNINIKILDAGTLGSDISLDIFKASGNLTVYDTTTPDEVEKRIFDADVVIVNKIKLNSTNLSSSKRLKLICVTATGYDNIDIDCCCEHGIAVCNVKGYSTDSVAQHTMAMALSLVNHLGVYDRFVKSNGYTQSGIQNRIEPVFHEMSTMTWGIVGLGAIGKRTAELARAFGCNVVAYKRTPEDGYSCVELDELCRVSDIISIHLPLTDSTKNIISREKIALMKKNAIVLNVARGAVTDETALADAVINGQIGGLGIDVYSVEPMEGDSPCQKLTDCDNVILTPHCAWGAYEARMRCMKEISENIKAFYSGQIRNRVDIG